MALPFVGELRIFAGTYAPVGWAFCNGQLLSISQNETLFVLIGTTYGGDGVTTFALPDLRGRSPAHPGPDLSFAQSTGAEQVTLTSNQLPSHTHTLQATTEDGVTGDPTGALWGQADARTYSLAPPDGPMHGSALGTAGGSQPHDNMMPFVAVSFIIALEGIFPSPA